MSELDYLNLGKQQDYQNQYNPALLQTVPRVLSRAKLPQVTFFGEDRWTAFELSWLDKHGKPQVAIAEFKVPWDSPNIIESKSFKYYLNSFNQTRIHSKCELWSMLIRDLSESASAPVEVELFELDEFGRYRESLPELGQSIDELPIREAEEPSPDLLEVSNDSMDVVWRTHLFKSNCPVTGQPDWASLWIGLKGQKISPESLLSYLVAFRNHQDFHENCVERVFSDLWHSAKLDHLWVYARYTRRGGLDINPFRSSEPMETPKLYCYRQ